MDDPAERALATLRKLHAELCDLHIKAVGADDVELSDEITAARKALLASGVFDVLERASKRT